MSWEPIAEAELWANIISARGRMTPEQSKFWELIKLQPRKWSEDSYGELGSGFWVVALIGSRVVWYNDIEEGFNQSTYTDFGKIDDYCCNQDQLEWVVQHIINLTSDNQKSDLRPNG